MSATHRIGGHPVEELLSAELDRALNPEEAETLAAHLRACGTCTQLRARYDKQHRELRTLSRTGELARDREQIWAAIMSRQAVTPRRSPALGGVTFVVVVLLAAAVAAFVLVERTLVAAPPPGREVIATAAFALPGGGTGSLTIEHGSALARPGQQTGVGARAEIRLPQPATRGSAEIRFKRDGDVSYGILGSAPDLSGASRLSFGGAFPRPAGTDPVTYEVWLHLETDVGSIDSTPIVVGVRPTRRGEEGSAR